MDKTTAYLCKNIQGVKFGYVQSDEISLLLTDFDSLTTDMWFDGNLQKMASIAASMATARFNQLRMERFARNSGIEPKYRDEPYIAESEIKNFKLAMFDARVFQISSPIEVENYFIWRQQDATRNSISSVAQSLYSPKELNGVKTDGMQELIFRRGINWNDYTPREKRGGIITKFERNFVRVCDETISPKDNNNNFVRNIWELDVETPVFTQDREYLRSRIPQQHED
jgi:tRNA(His) 5'-end guanylyltransferase